MSSSDVFINCPFDEDFTAGFRALVFGVIACGFRVRCALEVDDAAETRIEKLYRIIEQSRFGIHDISRTELDNESGLPRFNMPLELGIFLGAKRFGQKAQKQKRCMVLDCERYRYQTFISDLAGVDIKAHNGIAREMVGCVRAFLATSSKRKSVPTASAVLSSYDRFMHGLPEIARAADLDHEDLLFPDYAQLVVGWVRHESERPPSPLVGEGDSKPSGFERGEG